MKIFKAIWSPSQININDKSEYRIGSRCKVKFEHVTSDEFKQQFNWADRDEPRTIQHFAGCSNNKKVQKNTKELTVTEKFHC